MHARMVNQKTANTEPELAVRRKLHAMGLRYRVGVPVPGMPRRSMDIAFTKVKVAVFIDGCFWHGCPEHHVPPKANAKWWHEKVVRNEQRDEETSEHLQLSGWTVLRFWEHEDANAVALAIAAKVRRGAE